jgi:hypothetical protein
MKRLTAAVIVALFVIANPSLSSAAGTIDEQYSVNNGADNRNKVGVFFEENVDTLRMPSLLFSYQIGRNIPLNVVSYCTGLNDPACDSAEFMKYYALMPPCKSLTEVDCIESIYAVAPGSPARIKGVYKESIPEKVVHQYQPSPDNGLPQGSVSGVWEIPNIKHGGGSTNFVAIGSRVGSLKREGSRWIAQPPGSDPWGSGDFRAAIYPVNIVRDARYKANVSRIMQQPNGSNSMAIDHPSQLPFDVCAIVGDGVCAMRQAFPENIKFGMVIRFSKVINGWMHGRIDSPEIDYELTTYGTRVDMKGQATRVPILAGWASPSDFSETERKQNSYLNNANGGSSFPGASGNYSMDQLNLWARVLKDKAVANPTQWIFYNLPERDIEAASTCIKSSKTLAGFVTTNSTTYTATPPIYNEQTGTLDYKVASPLFLADGKVFQGKYNLYIDSKVARCIYKFSNAPISASVSITSSDGGQQNVATTVVNEDNGWLHLSATGFTFSSPTLKVKLTQDASAVATTPAPSATPTASTEPAPTTSAAPVAVAKKKSTITCVKGKTTKKVSAVSPKCPAGFKKKA